jgi:hypothetical protein
MDPSATESVPKPLKPLGKLLIVAIIVGVLTGVIVLRLPKLTEELARIPVSPSLALNEGLTATRRFPDAGLSHARMPLVLRAARRRRGL